MKNDASRLKRKKLIDLMEKLLDRPEELPGAYASADFFPLLGVQAQLGRVFLPEDEIHARAGSMSPYEMGHDAKKYPLERILALIGVKAD